jgi:hypothetical protein
MDYQSVEIDQMKNLPSEDDLPAETNFDVVETYRKNHIVKKCRKANDPEYLEELEDKAIRVYEDGMDPEMDFKHRKSSADAIMEIQGRKGGKSKDTPVGPTIVFSDDAVKNLTNGLAGLLAKDVTRYEDNKLASSGDE